VVRKPEVFQSSIICVGAFNPPIITPEWLNRHKLIGNDDANEARRSVSLLTTPQVSQFETQWFGVQALENQLAFTSKGVVNAAFRDLVVGVLTLLPQTPVTAMGINFLAHYKLASLAEYHAVGDALAPKGPWSELVKLKGHEAGLSSLTMQIREMTRAQMAPITQNAINITVQPSTQFPTGIFLMYNDHRAIAANEDDAQLPAVRAAGMLDASWEAISDQARLSFGVLIDAALAHE